MSFFRRAGAAIARIFESAADPAAEADRVLLYSKDDAGASQLYARSDDGTVYQLTPSSNPPLDEFVYIEDFLNFSAVKDYSVGGSAIILDPNPVPTFVGALQLQSFANGDAISVSCSDGSEFLDLSTGLNTFIGRIQPPFGPPTALADFSIHVGWVQNPGPIYPLVQFGTYFRAGFAENGNSNWWAVDTLTGGSADTGVAVNTGGFTQTLMITFDRPAAVARFFINGVLVATLPLFGGSLIVGMGATWNDISRGGDAYLVDFLCTKKRLNRGV